MFVEEEDIRGKMGRKLSFRGAGNLLSTEGRDTIDALFKAVGEERRIEREEERVMAELEKKRVKLAVRKFQQVYPFEPPLGVETHYDIYAGVYEVWEDEWD